MYRKNCCGVGFDYFPDSYSVFLIHSAIGHANVGVFLRRSGGAQWCSGHLSSIRINGRWWSRCSGLVINSSGKVAGEIPLRTYFGCNGSVRSFSSPLPKRKSYVKCRAFVRTS